MLPDVSENVRNMCLKIYKLDVARFLTAPGLVLKGILKKTIIYLDLLTDINMLLMVEKGIRRGICNSVYGYGKSNNKFMKKNDKNEESSYIQ